MSTCDDFSNDEEPVDNINEMNGKNNKGSKTPPKKSKPKSKPVKPTDAYRIAHEKVMAALPRWKQTEITELHTNKDFNNRHWLGYIEYVIELAEYGSTQVDVMHEKISLKLA